jgi:hypothetical protein
VICLPRDDRLHYTLGNLASAPLSIFAVQAKVCARKNDAATRAVRTRIRSNGDVANGATVGLASSYTYLSDIFETDPDTPSRGRLRR